MDKPMFAVSRNNPKPPPDLAVSMSEDLLGGKYDALFSGSEKP
jgi:hypothetical protein